MGCRALVGEQAPATWWVQLKENQQDLSGSSGSSGSSEVGWSSLSSAHRSAAAVGWPKGGSVWRDVEQCGATWFGRPESCRLWRPATSELHELRPLLRQERVGDRIVAGGRDQHVVHIVHVVVHGIHVRLGTEVVFVLLLVVVLGSGLLLLKPGALLLTGAVVEHQADVIAKAATDHRRVIDRFIEKTRVPVGGQEWVVGVVHGVEDVHVRAVRAAVRGHQLGLLVEVGALVGALSDAPSGSQQHHQHRDVVPGASAPSQRHHALREAGGVVTWSRTEQN
ncbi:Leucine--tRNA ligase, partial [Frankliniella fusca]